MFGQFGVTGDLAMQQVESLSGGKKQGRLRSPLRPQSELPGARYAQAVLLFLLYCTVLQTSLDIESTGGCWIWSVTIH